MRSVAALDVGPTKASQTTRGVADDRGKAARDRSAASRPDAGTQSMTRLPANWSGSSSGFGDALDHSSGSGDR